MPQGILNDNSRAVCKGAHTARCPVALRQQAITRTRFCQIQQVLYCMAQDLYPSSKRTGATVILR